MKLLYCTACHDVRQLQLADEPVTTCKCGASTGGYLEDGYHAWVDGPCHAMFIDNGSFETSLAVRGPAPVKFRAGWIEDECETLRVGVPEPVACEPVPLMRSSAEIEQQAIADPVIEDDKPSGTVTGYD